MVSVDRSAEDAVQRIHQDRPQQVGFNGSIPSVGLKNCWNIPNADFFFVENLSTLLKILEMMNQLEYPKQVGIFQPIFALGRNFKGVRATPERVYPQVMLETCAQRLDLSKSVQVSFREHGVHAICFVFLWEQMCEM